VRVIRRILIHYFPFVTAIYFLTLRTFKPVVQAKQVCSVCFYGLRRARAGVGNQTAILNSSVAFAYIGCSFKAKFVKIKLQRGSLDL